MDLNDLNVLKQIQPNDLRNTTAPTGAPPPPPLPIRPNQRPQSTPYGLSNYQYTSSSPLLGNYGSSYGTYGYGYSNPYALPSYQQQNHQPLLRAAEENYRTAFQSIESVVHAFSSISAMFESTFHALHNSFRAVIGVADQFYSLKQQLSNILSTFALFRLIKYVYKKLLRILRLNSIKDKHELWNKISTSNSTTDTNTQQLLKELNGTNSWPIILFFGIIIGGPYLIWKLLIKKQSKDETLWMQGKIDHFIAISEYDFDAENRDELSFKRGQKIIIAPKEYQPKMRGWLLGTIDGHTSGIMPANYLKLLGKKMGSESTPIITSNGDDKQYDRVFEEH